MTSRRWWGALGIAVAVGAALRLFHLGSESVWFDEAYSIHLGRQSLARIWDERLTDIHPPLYYVVLHGWMLIAGHSEAGARLLSTICSLATIPAAALVAERLFDRRVALGTAALLAISPFQVEFAQEARMYALLCLTGTLSTGAFVTFFDRDRRPWRIVYVVSTALMLYTHIYSVFVVAAQVTSLAIVWYADRDGFRRAFPRWLGASAVVALLYVPWLTSLMDQVSRVQGAFWIPRPWPIAVVFPLAFYGGLVPAVVILPLAAYGLKRLGGQPRMGSTGLPPAVFVAPWFAAPIVLPFLLSFVGSPIFHNKYTIAASVPFSMLAAVGFVEWPWARWRPALAAAVVTLTAGWLAWYYVMPQKDGWRRAAATLEAQAQANDVVLFYPWFNQISFDYYTRREDVTRLPLISDLETPLPDVNAIPALVEQAVAARRRVWLVVQQGIPRRSQILEELGRRMTPVAHMDAEHVELFLFER